MRPFNSTLLCLLSTILPSAAQNFPIGTLSITLTDPSRSNRQIAVEIFYPSTVAGSSMPVAGSAGERFSVIALGHGFSMTYDAYSNFWNELVPQGYIIILPETETGPIPFPVHGDFTQDLNFCLSYFQSENNNPASLFFGKISGKTAVMGHSMGGGCSFLAAGSNPGITTVVGFAPAETNPSAVAASANISVPTLVFAGSKDNVTPPADNGLLMYNSVPASCKTFITITDGAHCRFAQSNFLCEFGETSVCAGCSFLDRTTHHAITFRFLNPWLRFYLKGECPQFDVFQNLLATAMDVTALQSCGYALPVAEFTIAGATEFCEGGNVTLSATGNYEFLWSTADTSRNITIMESGNYRLIAADEWDCRDTSGAAQIIEYPLPIATIEQRGDTLLANSSGSIQWFIDNNLLADSDEIFIIPASPGWYHAIVTDSNGCIAATDSVQVVVTSSSVHPSQILTIHPNPTSGKLFFNRQTIQADILNIYGEKVMEIEGSEANLSALPPGIFLLRSKGNVFRILKN